MSESELAMDLEKIIAGRKGKAVGLMAKHLVYGLGTFHCMSQQQPSP